MCRPLASLPLLLICCAITPSASGQYPPTYIVDRAGLFGAGYTGSTGFQWSYFEITTLTGYAAGGTDRYVGEYDYRGAGTWVYDAARRTTVQTGFFGAAHTGSSGYRYGETWFLSNSGHAAGYSERVLGVDTYNGQNTWVYNPNTGTTVQTGLTGVAYTGSAGYQYGENSNQNASGHVAGYTRLVTDVSGNNGQHTWVYNPNTGTTVQTGLSTAAHSGTSGQQTSTNDFLAETGQVAGMSTRYSGSDQIGQDTWVWNPNTGLTVQTGITSGAHTGTGGYRNSLNLVHNAAGVVGGVSQRFSGADSNGYSAWVYNPVSDQTTQVGYTGAAYTGPGGFKVSTLSHINRFGVVAGVSALAPAPDGSSNGQHTWIHNVAGGSTVQTGLTTSAHTGSNGYQLATISHLNSDGQAAGESWRVLGVNTYNGRSSWVHDPATETTIEIGLTTLAHTGSNGYQINGISQQNEAGFVAGGAMRVLGVSTENGNNLWVYNPSTRATTQTGLTGVDYTGSNGYQSGELTYMSSAGHVVGFSHRVTGTNTVNGQHTWLFNPATGTTTRTGLTGPDHTGPGGFQVSNNEKLNDAGHVVGTSTRFTGDGTSNGLDTWAHNPNTGVTVQTGLTGGAFTGTGGYQLSGSHFQNPAGRVAGSSWRIAGERDLVSSEAWYHDPATGQTHQITAGVPGAVRLNDGLSYSDVRLLTNNGFALGTFQFFASTDAGQERAYLYRPDVGFHQLNHLVDGGLTVSGWENLATVMDPSDLTYVFGEGLVLGQNPEGVSLFVLHPVPEPATALLFGFVGLFAHRRRARRRLARA